MKEPKRFAHLRQLRAYLRRLSPQALKAIAEVADLCRELPAAQVEDWADDRINALFVLVSGEMDRRGSAGSS